MDFHIYVVINKKMVFVGETKYISDAKSVLKNWGAGYISHEAEILHKKNWDVVKKVAKLK